MKSLNLLTLIAIVLAGAAFAHTGVKNAAVKARMDAMSGIADGMKVLGQMAKGETGFDQSAAQAAATAIARHAAATPELFEAREDDPKSEAKQAIWSNFDDFTSKSRDLEEMALGLATSITGPADLGPAMASLAANCKACHKAYRE
ncbi:cytochrome c [Roseobacter sp. YSTF-M11]|uniref:Cytochrome c n=1 Tax=Roseobacter insulae TaxID=2859783 RepID=A0A9X1FZB5_9RHOB|nr:cytochrome c [Roseobacter insulae]MBW4710451.1 cytochrome c [Roseobacter insulae]